MRRYTFYIISSKLFENNEKFSNNLFCVYKDVLVESGSSLPVDLVSRVTRPF